MGVVMGEGKVEMEEDKVAGVLKWPTPQCVRDVRKFLGLANYYRRFVKDFAKVALPMNKLTRKDEKWKWEEEQQKAFERLKQIFTSRPTLSDWEKGVEGDNENETLLKPEWIKQVRVGEVIVEGVDILERIRKSEARDDEVIKAVEEIKRAGVKMLRDEEWREEDGLMLKEGKVYMPKDETLRVEIIRLHHDTPMGGHGGQWKTAEMVTRNFWWPGVTREVKRYVKGCDACQRNKNRTE